MRISKPVALIDEEIAIEVKKLQPFQHVVIRAQTKDAEGTTWSSEALFCSDQRGRLRLSKTAPLDGSYRGVDSMGLFWSMLSEEGEKSYFKIPDEMVVHFDLIIDKQPVLSREVRRLKKSPEVKRFSVKERGLVGALYIPSTVHPLPVIITLGGFTGGLYEGKAQLLASHGFAVLALAYFGIDGLPSKLENIPLEYFAKAFEWIKAQPDLDANKIGLYGISRGGELALLLGSVYPENIKALVAVVPSSVQFGALEKCDAPAWTLAGNAIGTFSKLPTIDLTSNLGKDSKHPLVTTPLVMKTMEDLATVEAAAIAVEKIRCPLLLFSGGIDQMWPSSLFVTAIKERLKKKDAKIPVKLHNYPLAGHQIDLPYIPTSTSFQHPPSGLWFSMGGNPHENDRASRDAWQKTLVFFQNKLK